MLLRYSGSVPNPILTQEPTGWRSSMRSCNHTYLPIIKGFVNLRSGKVMVVRAEKGKGGNVVITAITHKILRKYLNFKNINKLEEAAISWSSPLCCGLAYRL